MKIKLKDDSSIRTNGVCDLEEIMGESDGHAVGFDGEDIDWKISENKKDKSWNVIDIHEKKGWITIRYIMFYSDMNKEPTDIGTGKLPQEWLEKIGKVITTHCSNRIEDIILFKRTK